MDKHHQPELLNPIQAERVKLSNFTIAHGSMYLINKHTHLNSILKTTLKKPLPKPNMQGI